MADVGRPTVFDKDTIQKLEEAFALGCTDLEACLLANISKSSLYNYQSENPEFLERKEKLKETPILLARKAVIEGLNVGIGRADLGLKFLERKKKDEFSLRTELTGPEGKDLFKPTEEEQKKVAAALKTIDGGDTENP